MTSFLKTISYSMLILLCFASDHDSSAQSETELSFRFAHYDRDFNNIDRDRTQTGLGISLSHSQSIFDDKIILYGTLTRSQKLANTGAEVEDLLGLENAQNSSHQQLSEAYAMIKPLNNVELSIGRFEHKSLLLKSKTRLLPSTFQGVSLKWGVNDSLDLKAWRFNKWSPRANDSFSGFETAVSTNNTIQSINIVSLNHEHKYGSSHLEVLHAQDYLTKIGLESKLALALNESFGIKLNSGIFTSQDAGDLFVAGADSNLDTINEDSSDKRINHDGLGTYIQIASSTKWHNTQHTFSLTHSRFSDAWLEDSFSDDHGTSPFPTSTMGPDLTNHHERIWMVSYKAKLNDGFFNGLSNTLSYANGYGAYNSIGQGLGLAQESWAEIDIRYKPQKLKALSARLRYRDYMSSETGSIAGVKSNRDELRLSIDYSFRF